MRGTQPVIIGLIQRVLRVGAARSREQRRGGSAPRARTDIDRVISLSRLRAVINRRESIVRTRRCVH